jgi:hypothetical protein
MTTLNPGRPGPAPGAATSPVYVKWPHTITSDHLSIIHWFHDLNVDRPGVTTGAYGNPSKIPESEVCSIRCGISNWGQPSAPIHT